MDKIKIVRLIGGLVIVVGFFLPWMDMGEMGEMMSGLAAMAGGDFSPTFSAFQLASGGEEIPGDSYPLLWVVPVFGLLAAIAKGKKQVFLGSIAAIIIILIGGPILKEGAQMMSPGMSTWAIGKILSIIGCVLLLITGFADGSKTVPIPVPPAPSP
jgi:4-amino-4-deoxy-L-arabinose transferase-like glycosyltransferase